jgi:thiamine biosynthesis protein ThiI
MICKRDLPEIKKCLLNQKVSPGQKTFRVSAARSDKQYEMTSDELNRELGKFLIDERGLAVDLKNPDINFHVDIGRTRAVVYGNIHEGACGLPVGTAGRVLCLVSGGIDSPVAAYQMMKRGAEVVLAHFQNQTKVTDEVSEKIIDLAKKLAQFQPNARLLIVPFADLQRQIIMKVPADLRMIVSRRLMFKISEKIARDEKCQALVTGDSLGQVASQTLENLTAVYGATDFLKLSPLIGSNKVEITKIAERIGTLPISIRPYEDCCSLFVARHPKTKARAAEVAKCENSLDLSALDKITPISYNIGMS